LGIAAKRIFAVQRRLVHRDRDDAGAREIAEHAGLRTQQRLPLRAWKREQEAHVVMQPDLVAQLHQTAREAGLLEREKVVVARADEQKVRGEEPAFRLLLR